MMPSLDHGHGNRDADHATLWIGATLARRASALEELLALTDAFPQTARPDGTPSRCEKVVAVHQALGSAAVPYAFGGGLALAYFGEPRATVDIDLNVFLPAERWTVPRDALNLLGLKFDAANIATEHEARLDWDGTEVHLFFSYDELHAAMPAAVREVPFARTTIPVVAPEHLLVRKTLLDRPKDWIDIEALLAANPNLDLAEADSWVCRLAGPDDPRTTKLQELVRRLVI
jgi:Nucleotidyl transferase AbiEii toxin, Type IV TA system